MVLKELDNIEYSWTDGSYYKEFDHNKVHYKAILQPYPTKNGQCIIRKIDDTEDINNITASEDSQLVFRKGALPFKPEELKKAIIEFCKNN